MKKCLLIAAMFVLVPPDAFAGGKYDIEIMTQNQYLGADLTAIVAAPDEFTFNQEVIKALASVANNNLPERAIALADSILERYPHLVGLQEVYSFSCTETGTMPNACLLYAAAFNDHLDETLDALNRDFENYRVVGTVQNLTLPGLPVFLDGDIFPDILVTVIDRDVILARHDVEAAPVDFGCPRPSVEGCNFALENTVSVPTALGPVINIERGFVGVDAVVNGQAYRFVNTHLEVKFPAPDPIAQFFQAAQASELLFTLTAVAPTPEGSRLLVVGDFNSSPDQPSWPDPVFGPFLNPYQQFTKGALVDGPVISAPYTDIWDLRPGKPPGHTCCQAADLMNAKSVHRERIDLFFALPAPRSVKANVLDNNPDDKTATGLWPSDHSSVSARLTY